MMKNVYKGIRIAQIILLSLTLLVWGGFLIYCQILTDLHENEFSGQDAQTNMSNAAHLKVLEYSDDTAKVYYYDEEGGMVIHFVHEGEVWALSSWGKPNWSRSGSADDIIWPYVWHSAEGKATLFLFSFFFIAWAILTPWQDKRLFAGTKNATQRG